MALTEQKKVFAHLIDSGANQTEAAIAAGYSEHTAQVKASQLMKDKSVQEYLAKLKADRNTLADKLNDAPDPKNYRFKNPRDYLMHYINDPMNEEESKANIALGTYKVDNAGTGKKANAQEEGERAAQETSVYAAIGLPTSKSVN